MPKGNQGRTILAMDLSLNGSAFVVLKVYKHSVKMVESVLVDNHGIPTENMSEKLSNIYFNLVDLMQRHEVTDIVRERGFTRFNKATQKLFRVVGLTEFALYCEGFPGTVPEISPTEVKKCITGNGKADKAEVATQSLKYLTRPQREKGIYFESDDVSDAMAVGISYAVKNKLIPKKNFTKK